MLVSSSPATGRHRDCLAITDIGRRETRRTALHLVLVIAEHPHKAWRNELPAVRTRWHRSLPPVCCLLAYNKEVHNLLVHPVRVCTDSGTDLAGHTNDCSNANYESVLLKCSLISSNRSRATWGISFSRANSACSSLVTTTMLQTLLGRQPHGRNSTSVSVSGVAPWLTACSTESWSFIRKT